MKCFPSADFEHGFLFLEFDFFVTFGFVIGQNPSLPFSYLARSHADQVHARGALRDHAALHRGVPPRRPRAHRRGRVRAGLRWEKDRWLVPSVVDSSSS